MIDIPLELRLQEHEAMPKEFLADFANYVQHEMKRSGIPGAAIAVIKEDRLVFLETYGTRKAGRNQDQLPIDAHTVFRLGSLSKGFTGLLTSKLIEEKYFGWEDGIQKFFPSFHLKNTSQASRIQVRHILSHTTGLARHAYTNLTEKGLPLQKIVPHFSEVEVYGKEGQYYGYQNTAFSMIEEVVAQSTQRSFETMLQEKVFMPASMSDASCNYRDLKDGNNVAHPHQYWSKRGRYVPVRLNQKYFNAISAGGVSASISDMSQWMQVLMGNMPKVASEQVLDLIFEPVVSTKRFGEYPMWPGLKEAAYGMGWRILEFANRDLMYHGGTVNDYRSEIAIDRENKIGICMLINAQSPVANRVIRTFFKRYDQYLMRQEKSKYVAS